MTDTDKAIQMEILRKTVAHNLRQLNHLAKRLEDEVEALREITQMLAEAEEDAQ